MICLKPVDPEHTPLDPEGMPIAFNILKESLSKYQHSGPVASPIANGIAKVLRGWRDTVDNSAGHHLQQDYHNKPNMRRLLVYARLQ